MWSVWYCFSDSEMWWVARMGLPCEQTARDLMAKLQNLDKRHSYTSGITYEVRRDQ